MQAGMPLEWLAQFRDGLDNLSFETPHELRFLLQIGPPWLRAEEANMARLIGTHGTNHWKDRILDLIKSVSLPTYLNLMNHHFLDGYAERSMFRQIYARGPMVLSTLQHLRTHPREFTDGGVSPVVTEFLSLKWPPEPNAEFVVGLWKEKKEWAAAGLLQEFKSVTKIAIEGANNLQ